MIQAILPLVGDLAGSWIKGKTEEKRAKTQVKLARAEAEAEVMKVAATHEAGWEKIMAQASQDSWKDEAWTILFIVIIAMCFIPPLQPFVERGFAALETTPDWFQWAMYASIAASFGLRGIKGLKR
jgi:hypothetical protein|tara:strand:- start:176 stop:553 length:378 start_codon:yes stop_codon:yes gene_type:complete